MSDSDPLQRLLEKLASRHALVGVVGLGYVGLPLVRALLEAGHTALGFDSDPDKIAQLLDHRCYIEHLSGPWIGQAVGSKRFQPTGDMSRLGEADAILICVPTPLSPSRDPDLQFVTSTAEQIATCLRPGQLVVLESTTYPGTTRDELVPRLQAGGLQAERDFFVAYSPEREDPGNPSHSAPQIPKVIGAVGPRSLQAAEALYRDVVCQTVPVGSCEVAEACKILENTYRSVNIAMVNELKKLFDRLGINIWEVIAAARTKPFGFQAFYPGPGLGGHCIPIDPFYLAWLARRHEAPARFIELAGEINSSMPQYVVDRVGQALNSQRRPVRGSRVALLGVAYKRDVDDPRESPAFRIFELLEQRGAVLSYSDPHVPRLPEMRNFRVPPLDSQPLSAEYLESQDCVVIVTDHAAFDWPLVARHARLIVDTRNALRDVSPRDHIWQA